MNSLKLKQFALALCVVLSLFASSYAACGCAHHQGKAEIGAPSCHQEMAGMSSDEMPTAESLVASSANDSCVCMKAAPRVFDKSPNLKIEKQTAAILPRIVISSELISAAAAAQLVVYSKPLYLSDSFYNIKSPRAPPLS